MYDIEDLPQMRSFSPPPLITQPACISHCRSQDSDLVDVLLKQDVDLGFSLILPDVGPATTTAAAASKLLAAGKQAAASAGKKAAACSGGAIDETEDDIQKWNALLEINSDEGTATSRTKDDASATTLLGDVVEDERSSGFWSDATIDAETGEYIQHLPLQLDDTLIPDPRRHLAELAEKEKADELENEELIKSLDDLLFNSNAADVSKLQDCDSDEELGAVGSAVAAALPRDEEFRAKKAKLESSLDDSSLDEGDFYANELKEFLDDMMIQAPTFQHPRTVMPNYGPHSSSNNLFQSPYYHPHHHHHHPHHPHYGPNFSSAVSSSIHLTNSSSDSENGTSASTYKMDHDLALYSNTSSELNMTSDGFLNSILNDEDLHLMDIGAHEGMYPMRMLDSNATNNSTASSMMSGPVASMIGLGAAASGASLPVGGALGASGSVVGSLGDMGAHGDRLEASSDSAVSSMASEPMSSLSDGEWGDTGSDSAQEYSQKYAHHHNGHQGGGYGAAGDSGASRQSTSIAQKKHHMFGKRYFQEQNSATPANGGTKIAGGGHHVHPGSLKYDYSAYENFHHLGHPNAALHQNGHHLSIGAAVPNLPPPPPPPPHHQLTVDNMKTYQEDLNRTGGGLHDIKYSCSPDFAYQQQQQPPQLHPPQPTPRMINEYLHHNHTYPMPPQNSGAVPKPQARDKKAARASAKALMEEEVRQHNRSMSEHITRDEKRAKALGIPIPVPDIINLPMDEFNERLSKYELSETQLSLIRDIRRRGKNKVAAQNCRKRKLDQIMSLADEVKDVKKQKDDLVSERNSELNKQKKIKEKFTALYRHVFQYLRDPDGNLYSASQYSLQQSADGSVYLLPRDRKAGGSGGSSSHMNPDYGRSQNHTQDG